MARHGRYPQGFTITIVSNHFLDQHHSTMHFFISGRMSGPILFWSRHVKTQLLQLQGIESKSHDIMLEEPCRTNAWSIPISSPISKEDTCIRDIKKLLVRPGSPRWAHFMVGSVHHSPWIREVCHFVEVMAPVGLEWFSVGSRRLKNTLVGGFKHFLFSVSYMGQSFPLTNSYFSRWLKPRSSLVLQELVQLWRLGKLRSVNDNQKSACSTHRLDSFPFHLNSCNIYIQLQQDIS